MQAQPVAVGREHALGRILPAVFLLYASLLPPEVRVDLVGQIFYAPRIVAFACLPWLWTRFTSGTVRLDWRDGLIAFASLWMIGSFTVVYGISDGLVRGGALATDILLPYLIARASVSNLKDFRRILVIFAPGLFIAGLTLPIESIARTLLVRPLFIDLFGPLPVYANGEVVISGTKDLAAARFGLIRASGPFPHPILAGLALGTLGALYVASGLRGWPRYLGAACMLMVFFTLSSAAFLAVILGVAFIAYDWLQKRVSFLDWRKLVLAGSFAFVLVQLGTTNGVAGLVQRLSLVPQTAFYRRLIWRYGVQSVDDNWLFGIGFEGYKRLPWMPPSIDNYWLMLSIRHGVVVPLAILVVVIATIVRLATRSVHAGSEADRATLVALSYSLFSAALLAATVALFGGAQVWFASLVAFGVSLTTKLQTSVAKSRAVRPQ